MKNSIPFVVLAAVLQSMTLVAHFLIQALSPSHPTIAAFLTSLSIGCSLASILICVYMIGQSMLRRLRGKAARIGRSKLWAWIRRHTAKKQKSDTLVPIAQLARLHYRIGRLGCSFHSMTPEMENARRTHFQILGEALPPLELPLQNTALHAEFEGLVKVTKHFGFPFLESVRLQQKDYDFLNQWVCNLEACLQQLQRLTREQQATLDRALTTAMQQHQALGKIYPLAQDAGYQRIEGAFRLLKTMASDQHIQRDGVLTYVCKLQSDVEKLAHKAACQPLEDVSSTL